MSKPLRSAISAAATNWSRISVIWSRVISAGIALLGDHGMADAETSGQLSALVTNGASMSSQPTWVEPFRPEWPIWQQILASVSACTKSVSRRHAVSCSGAYSPGQPGVMRPVGDTQVIST